MTLHNYECPVHGVFEVACTGEPPDLLECGGLVRGPCGHSAVWRPSAPAVRTRDSSRRALTEHVRGSNPWTSGFDRPEIG
jgi:hypothetical protein